METTERIDVFAHVLPPNFFARLCEIEPPLPRRQIWFNTGTLHDMGRRRDRWDHETRQVISIVNALPEDFCDPDLSAELCWQANEELLEMRRANTDMFEAAVLSVPMNNLDAAKRIIHEQVLGNEDAVGIQIFTRALNKSIADKQFWPLFQELCELRVGAWLHPVFDTRKPDNNMVFSWEYELTMAMYQMVESKLFREMEDLKIICHHAGGMVPYFSGRVDRIMPRKFAEDLKRFYVDTAILGNPKALELALDFYGPDHVMFGTDAPLGIQPAGATKEIVAAVMAMRTNKETRAAIFSGNYRAFLEA